MAPSPSSSVSGGRTRFFRGAEGWRRLPTVAGPPREPLQPSLDSLHLPTARKESSVRLPSATQFQGSSVSSRDPEGHDGPGQGGAEWRRLSRSDEGQFGTQRWRTRPWCGLSFPHRRNCAPPPRCPEVCRSGSRSSSRTPPFHPIRDKKKSIRHVESLFRNSVWLSTFNNIGKHCRRLFVWKDSRIPETVIFMLIHSPAD